MRMSSRWCRSLPFLLLWPICLGCEPAPPPVPSESAQPRRPATPSPPSSPTPQDNPLARSLVTAHNRVRASVEPPAEPPLPELVWSDELARIAARWAAECRFSHNSRLDDQRLGENLAAFSDASGSADKAVGNWAAEAKDYDHAANRCTPGTQCGHYTQIVWRSTREVGCAVADCTTNSPFPQFPRWQLWVCNYSPPGNWVGERPY